MTRIKLFFLACWHLLKVFAQLIYGIWKVSGVPAPRVTIFGGSRFGQKDPYAVEAHALAELFINNDISVITGGGPGIMEAANCALPPLGGTARSLGIGVRDLERPNHCLHEYIELDYFFARKWLMTQYSQAFVVFPGGFGTLDELSEVITLIQTKKLKQVPIILLGKDYWQEFMQWLSSQALEHKLILTEELNLFTVTDNIHEAFRIIREDYHIKTKSTPPGALS